MLKIFISSTYADLKEYREAVNEQLHRMKVNGVQMEYFSSSLDEPTSKSLEELKKCNVYIGIIGHRFGTISPDQKHSITEREYMEAHDLYKKDAMRCLIYLADEEKVHIPPKLMESDELRERQQKFRQSLNRHTYKIFRSPSELAAWVAADLYSLDQVPPP
ncbi:DUF4062 domain-containing protein [Azotobacter beijerinckii]|uniref:DUF4062 domain-containing protein n=1 Tax=Azotobacter beijerinckii TaxID=170623 RepID=A0A1I4IV74_9GAMM|nr:DUF4062 domain-containing protein [Azotobacter beijerinckii]SFB65319.1 protein of unknown function [Azotobacter beijerinckii]SFL58204.1 protein of unknown function [Azotobacter beijerinckii]